MSAYVVVHATPKDADKMQEYGAGAGPLLADFGGEMVCRAPAEVLSGEDPHQLMVIVKFPTKQDATRWYNSAEYQALIPIRNEGMDSVFVLAGD